MDNAIFLQANKWVSEELLISITGLSKSMIKRARGNSWMQGREYRHCSPDCKPKDNNLIMYNRFAVDEWIERQLPPIVIDRKRKERISE